MPLGRSWRQIIAILATFTFTFGGWYNLLWSHPAAANQSVSAACAFFALVSFWYATLPESEAAQQLQVILDRLAEIQLHQGHQDNQLQHIIDVVDSNFPTSP